MNQRDLAIKRNNIARLVRSSNRVGSHRNCVRISPGNSLYHELMKLRVAYELLEQGHQIITEAIFENGCRADILDLDTGTVYEIVHGEQMTSLRTKAKRYPPGLTIISVCSLTGERATIR